MKKKVKVVGAVIENEQGEILCALRSPIMTLPNLWEFPGGKIEEGELPKQSLVREIQEELEADIEVNELLETVDLAENIDPQDAEIVADGKGGFYVLSTCNQSLANEIPLVAQQYESTKGTQDTGA